MTSAMDDTHIYQAFYQNLFHEMNRTFITDFTSKTRFKNFAAKEIILRQGEVGDCFYIVKDGTVKVVVKAPHSENEVVVTRLKKHEYFGELALLTPHNPLRQATIIAVVPTTLIQIMKDDFLELLEKHPKFEVILRQDMERIQIESSKRSW